MRSTVGYSHVERFSRLFVDERSHFYRRSLGRAHFVFERRPLTDSDIREHLRGRCWIAVLRDDATRILSADLDAKSGADAFGAMIARYERITDLMPEPVVFRSSCSGGVHLFWLLEHEVPTEPAMAMLRRYFSENCVEVGPGTCELRATTTESLRLPLGRESVLLHPRTLLPLPEVGEDIFTAIEYLTDQFRPHRSQDILDRVTKNARQQILVGGPSPLAAPPVRATEVVSAEDCGLMGESEDGQWPEHRQTGLAVEEIAAVLQVTRSLSGIDRYRQLQFLFDLLVAFKTAGVQELPLPKRRLVQMGGAHSGSYQRRIAWAETAGLIACTNARRARRQARRYQLLLPLTGEGKIVSLEEGLRHEDLTFLSSHLRRTIAGTSEKGNS
jgi:hypothetical protein